MKNIIKEGPKVWGSKKDLMDQQQLNTETIKNAKIIPLKTLVTKYSMPLKDAFLLNLIMYNVNSLFKKTKKGGVHVVSLNNKPYKGYNRNTPIQEIFNVVYADAILNRSFPLNEMQKQDIIGTYKLVFNKATMKTSSSDYEQYQLFYMSNEEAIEFLRDLNKEYISKNSILFPIIDKIENEGIKDNDEELLKLIIDVKQKELYQFFNEWFKDINKSDYKNNERDMKNHIFNSFIENNDIEMVNFILKNRNNLISNSSFDFKTEKEFIDRIYKMWDKEVISKNQLEKVRNLKNLFYIKEIYPETFSDVDKELYFIRFNFYMDKNNKLKKEEYGLPFHGKYFNSEEEAIEYRDNYINNYMNIEEIINYKEESLKVDKILQESIQLINSGYEVTYYKPLTKKESSNTLSLKELKEFFNLDINDIQQEIILNDDIFPDKKYLKLFKIEKIGNKYVIKSINKTNTYISNYFVVDGKSFDSKKEIQKYLKQNPNSLDKYLQNIELFKYMRDFSTYGFSFVPTTNTKKRNFSIDDIIPIKKFVIDEENFDIKEFLKENIFSYLDKGNQIETLSTIIYKKNFNNADIKEIIQNLSKKINNNSLLNILENKLKKFSEKKDEINRTFRFFKDVGEYEKLIYDLQDYSKFETIHRYYSKLGEYLSKIKDFVLPDKNIENEKTKLIPKLNEEFYEHIQDYRNDKDISELNIVQEFYLNRVQFGVALTKKEKQDRLNALYDTLSFFAEYYNIPKYEVGMYGKVTIELAGRGVKGSVATFHFYQNGTHVINLTKNGSDSFEKMVTNTLHEYTHYLDYITSQIVTDSKMSSFSEKKDLFISEKSEYKYSKLEQLIDLTDKIMVFEVENPNYKNVIDIKNDFEIISSMMEFINKYENTIEVKEDYKFKNQLENINNPKEKVIFIKEYYEKTKLNIKKTKKLYSNLKDNISQLKNTDAYQLLKDRSINLDNESNKKEKYYSTDREMFARIAETILHYSLKGKFGVIINPIVEYNTAYPIKREVEQLKPIFEEIMKTIHNIIDFNANEFNPIKEKENKKVLDTANYEYVIKSDTLIGGIIEILDKSSKQVVKTLQYNTIGEGIDEAKKIVNQLENIDFNNDINSKEFKDIC